MGINFSEDIYNAYLVSFEVGNTNALEINKAKLHLLSTKKQEKELRTEILSVKEKLENH